MSRLPFRLLALVLSLVIAASSAAQVRGRARIQGVVTDKESGKPIEGARVTIALADGSTEPIVTKSDQRGRWAALGLVGGTWNIDIEKDGYATSRGTANVSEVQVFPTIKTELVPEVTVEAPVVTDSVPQAAVQAVRAGEAFMKEQKFVEAAAEFEKALALIPDHVQIRQALAQAYYGARELPKAIAVAEPLLLSDPSNRVAAVLLAQLYLENGQLAEARKLIEAMPAGTMTDPVVFLNAGILSMNKTDTEGAIGWFTRAIDIDPNRHEGYYFRGLARLQQQKTREARADFEKVIALAPDSTEAAEAKQLMAAMK